MAYRAIVNHENTHKNDKSKTHAFGKSESRRMEYLHEVSHSVSCTQLLSGYEEIRSTDYKNILSLSVTRYSFTS